MSVSLAFLVFGWSALAGRISDLRMKRLDLDLEALQVRLEALELLLEAQLKEQRETNRLLTK